MKCYAVCDNCHRRYSVQFEADLHRPFCPRCEAEGFEYHPPTPEEFEQILADFELKPIDTPPAGEIMIRLVPMLKNTLKRAEAEPDYASKAGTLRGGIEAILSMLGVDLK